ncbi:MAG: porin, partial [Holophaga sp.]|nr:porin [Holophaga sp.]
MKIGFLAKPAFEATGSFTREGTTQNLFVRQMRLMVGGTLGTDFEYFFETDSPNLGKANADGSKTNTGLILQDAVFTYKLTKDIKIDAGLILVPLSHQSTQGATNLATWDYHAYAFQQNGAMGSSTGRDGGAQVRGVVGGKEGNLEFRLGVFQGKRLALTPAVPTGPTDRAASRNSLRLAGRAQWNFFEAEGGLFLGGTYLGAKKILAIGAGHDRQDDYSATAVDIFMDLPLGQDGIQGQWNHVTWNGKTWLPTIKKQTTDFAEFGYRFGAVQLAPMVRYESKKLDVPTVGEPDETRVGVGLAWWFKGHQSNLKAFYTRVEPKAPGIHTLKAYDQVNLQWQWLLW